MGRRKLELTSRKRCLVTEDEVSAQQASGRGAEEADPTLSTDLSCCLLLIGEVEASSGIYSPLAYRLRPRGDDLAEHHVMHLHEIHHKALNDDTAWGALIHVAARHPGWTPGFLALLVANCRTVHESFASFMSVSLARTRHDDVDRVFDRYPVYRPLAARFERLLRPLQGQHRRELAATGIARWCMSAPVIDLALSTYPEVLTLSAIPSAMRPDHRFRLAARVESGQIEAAAAAADRAFRKDNGGEVDTVALTETDAALDTAWGVWEDAFVAHLVASVPRLAALPTLPPNGHLQSAASLTRAAAAGGLTVELPHETDEAPLSDIESVQRLLNATTLALREFPYRGALAIPGGEVDLEEVLALCEASGRPHVVLHGRRVVDLARSFNFGSGDRGRLADLAPGPVFAIRNLIDHDGEEVILHTEVTSPDAFASLAGSWAGRGVAAVCVTASCFVEEAWQQGWLPALRVWPIVVLVDLGLAPMVGEGRLLGSQEHVYGTYLGLGRGGLRALAWHVDGHPHVMLVLGDDLTVQLFAGQLEDTLGLRLSMEDSDWSQWLDVLAAVTSNVLETEPALRYDAGGG